MGTRTGGGGQEKKEHKQGERSMEYGPMGTEEVTRTRYGKPKTSRREGGGREREEAKQVKCERERDRERKR